MEDETYIKKPKWLDASKESIGKLIKQGGEHEMQHAAGTGPVYLHKICQHKLRIKCHVLFENGHNATSASSKLAMPYGTVKGYFDDYNDEFPS